MTYLMRCFPAYLRLQARFHQLENMSHQVSYTYLDLIGKIEGMATQSGVLRQLLCKQHIGESSVLRVEIVPHIHAIRANDRAFSAQHRPNGTRNDAVPVQVAAAIEVATACDGNRKAIG